MTTQQLLVPSNATLKRNVMDYSLIVVGSFCRHLVTCFSSALQNRTGRCVWYLYRNPLCDERFVPVLPGWFADGCDGALLQYPVDDFGDEKIGLSSGPKTIVTFLLISIFTDSLSYFLTDPLVENDAFIAAFYGGAIFRLGRYLYFPGAKYECRYGCIGTCDR